MEQSRNVRGWCKREIPEKTRRPAASSGTTPDPAGSRTRFALVRGECSTRCIPEYFANSSCEEGHFKHLLFSPAVIGQQLLVHAPFNCEPCRRKRNSDRTAESHHARSNTEEIIKTHPPPPTREDSTSGLNTRPRYAPNIKIMRPNFGGAGHPPNWFATHRKRLLRKRAGQTANLVTREERDDLQKDAAACTAAMISLLGLVQRRVVNCCKGARGLRRLVRESSEVTNDVESDQRGVKSADCEHRRSEGRNVGIHDVYDLNATRYNVLKFCGMTTREEQDGQRRRLLHFRDTLVAQDSEATLHDARFRKSLRKVRHRGRYTGWCGTRRGSPHLVRPDSVPGLVTGHVFIFRGRFHAGFRTWPIASQFQSVRRSPAFIVQYRGVLSRAPFRWREGETARHFWRHAYQSRNITFYRGALKYRRCGLGQVAPPWFETRTAIGSRIDKENCCTIRVQSWAGDRDEVHFEPSKLVVRNLDPRSTAIVDKFTAYSSEDARGRSSSPGNWSCSRGNNDVIGVLWFVRRHVDPCACVRYIDIFPTSLTEKRSRPRHAPRRAQAFARPDQWDRFTYTRPLCRRVMTPANDVLRADQGEARWVWCNTGMEGWGETGYSRENPPTSNIVQSDPHVRKSGLDPTWNRTRFLTEREACSLTIAAPRPLTIRRYLLTRKRRNEEWLWKILLSVLNSSSPLFIQRISLHCRCTADYTRWSLSPLVSLIVPHTSHQWLPSTPKLSTQWHVTDLYSSVVLSQKVLSR
ncbi:hypothetical protein PR048_026320 [Dryococelus australis]|uniref:Uncharacterized protein n=1 Tax=Dryococelus australis TaxID=614101 RepID=A0ABQ9GL31_9NEOP|nr:hypothetical protein PR048_026320 [Dryococelus australis]